MHVRYVANSCFVITLASGRTLLTDPWFRGPCQETWWNYPPVHPQLEAELGALRPDWIYVSHLHHDHLHPPSLRLFPFDTPILIGRLNTSNLRGGLTRLGFSHVREAPFTEPFELEPGGCRAVLFGDFHATTSGQDSALAYDLDTSLYLLDQDGTRVFNAVDNTIQPQDAAAIRASYGHPHLAMLPYASASIYPMGMRRYDEAAKSAASREVRANAARRFAGLVAAMGAERVIPAGGEYVLGGPAASLSRFLPHPLQGELADALETAGQDRAKLVKLYAGDEIEVTPAAAALRRDPGALERGFTDEARSAYALTLADRTPAYAEVKCEALEPNWGRLMDRCARALRVRASAVGYAPSLDLVFSIRAYEGRPSFTYRVRMDDDPRQGGEMIGIDERMSPGRASVVYDLDERLLFCLVTGLLSWNAMEASALIGLERRPDVYDAELHRLIVFFTLPG